MKVRSLLLVYGHYRQSRAEPRCAAWNRLRTAHEKHRKTLTSISHQRHSVTLLSSMG